MPAAVAPHIPADEQRGRTLPCLWWRRRPRRGPDTCPGRYCRSRRRHAEQVAQRAGRSLGQPQFLDTCRLQLRRIDAAQANPRHQFLAGGQMHRASNVSPSIVRMTSTAPMPIGVAGGLPDRLEFLEALSCQCGKCSHCRIGSIAPAATTDYENPWQTAENRVRGERGAQPRLPVVYSLIWGHYSRCWIQLPDPARDYPASEIRGDALVLPIAITRGFRTLGALIFLLRRPGVGRGLPSPFLGFGKRPLCRRRQWLPSGRFGPSSLIMALLCC